MSTVRDALQRHAGREVASVGHKDSVLNAACLMNQRRIGSLVVLNGERVVGIFTERDVMTRVVAELRDPKTTTVGEVMTTPCLVCKPDDPLLDCQTVMTQQRIRHLPVVEEGNLVGILTQGDIMANSSRESQVEIRMLQDYLYGPTMQAPG